MSKKYNYKKEITEQLKGFKNHLKELGNSINTIKQKSNYAGCFLEWLCSEGHDVQTGHALSLVSYNDLLSFIDYCKLNSDSIKLINNKLRSIRNYYEYLKKDNPNITNPATNLYLKGTRHKIPSNLLPIKILEDIYSTYKTETLRQKRNKTILGLLIYQGITTEELHQLEPSHLKLKEGKIIIPGNRKRNSRTLDLKAFQVIELQEYVNDVRPKTINCIYDKTPSRKPDKIDKAKLNKQLFISSNGSCCLKSTLLHLFKELQKEKPEILHAKQIRASVIVNWLKTNNLRQVQYMAGHKYVSSTERYQLDNLENLQKKLEKLHPLNKT